MEKPFLIPIGKVVKTHGVRGAVKIVPYGETLGQTRPGETLFLLDAEGRVHKVLVLAGMRVQARAWIGEFEGIEDMDLARSLVGEELFVPEDRLPSLPEGEYYHYQLVGLAVETREGRLLGPLRSILETGGNDVFVVDCDGRELLIPAIENVVLGVDLEKKKITVDLPEGLE